MTPKEIMEAIVTIADERKAVEQMAIHVESQTTLTDYFIIMTGTSNTHIRALSDHIDDMMKKNYNMEPHHVEGVTSNWVLLDYSSVVVNIFTQDARELFALERLWADGAEIDISHIVKPN